MARTNRVDAIVTLRQYLENSHSPQGSDPLEYWKVKFCVNIMKQELFSLNILLFSVRSE